MNSAFLRKGARRMEPDGMNKYSYNIKFLHKYKKEVDIYTECAILT